MCCWSRFSCSAPARGAGSVAPPCAAAAGPAAGNRRWRIAFGELSQETCTFTPARQTLEAFEANGLLTGDELFDIPRVGAGESGTAALGGFLAVSEAYSGQAELVPLIKANGGAGPTIDGGTHEDLVQRMLQALRAAGPLDALFLSLHGAASADGEDDVEGALLEKIRAIVGPDLLIVSPCDHHANITARMVQHANALVGHETQPHHQFDTGHKAAHILFDALEHGTQLHTTYVKLPMVTQQDQYLTAEQPMGGWFDKARDFEQLDGVLDVSPYPMQPWLDVQEAGWSVVVTTEGDPHLATRLAREMGEWAWDRREEFMINERHAVAHAVAEAINTKQDEQIVILSDTGDSVYGGAPGDSTVILRELLAQQASAPASDASAGLLMLPVVDPQVVELAVQRWATSSSSDATLPPGVMLGGKVDSVFSSPVDVGRAKVLAIWDGTPSHVADIRHAVLPQCALLGLGRVRIAVMAEPTGGVNHPSLYESLGITVSDAAAIVLKTASNFQYFDDWSSRVLRVDTAGMTQSNLQAFDWVRAPRPIFPLDAAAAF